MSDATPGFNQLIPEAIRTPDRVDTRIGRLEFFDGFPTDETTRTVYDHLDFLRGVQVFLDFIPAASMEAVRRGLVAMGARSPHQLLIFDGLMDSNPLFLTGNTDTVYLLGQLRSAPVVELLRYVLTMLGKRCVLLDPSGGLATHMAQTIGAGTHGPATRENPTIPPASGPLS